MVEIRQRLGIARATVTRIRETQNQDLVSTETIFLQMRKVCELIAFGSLIANRDLYAQHHAEFAKDWRLKRMVERLKKINPAFFPVPTAAPVQTAPGHFHLGASVALSVTEDELVTLYDTCGRILHTRNPFSTDPVTHNIGYSVDEWLARLEGLMRHASRRLTLASADAGYRASPRLPIGAHAVTASLTGGPVSMRYDPARHDAGDPHASDNDRHVSGGDGDVPHRPGDALAASYHLQAGSDRRIDRLQHLP
jgi:hypothetical protein